MKLPDYISEDDVRFLDLCMKVYFESRILGNNLTQTELQQKCYTEWENGK